MTNWKIHIRIHGTTSRHQVHQKAMSDDLLAALGSEEHAILNAIGRGFKDVESIHFVTGVPVACIERKIACLVTIGALIKDSDGLSISDSRRPSTCLDANPILASKVLIVDDEPDIILFMRAVLEMEGFQVFEATNGKSAINLIKNDVHGEITCVITDFFMPQMNGVELCNEIRGSCSRKVAMFLMTAYLDQSQLEAIRCFDEKFMKPIDMDCLIACLGARAGT